MHERMRIGRAFEDEVCEVLRAHPSVRECRVVPTIGADPAARDLLLRRRYWPDGEMITVDGAFWAWDAKCGETIEWAAYKAYMEHDVPVVVIMRSYSGVLYYQNVRCIKFDDARGRASGHRVDIDGVLYPARTERASGTPFKYVDLASMKELQ
jgi:hypothetical protein